MTWPNLVLGVHPSTAGFGWTLFRSPNHIVDWEFVNCGSNERLGALSAVLERHRPESVVFEGDPAHLNRTPSATRQFNVAAEAVAIGLGMDVYWYRRAQTGEVFNLGPKPSRQNIADAIGEHIPSLWHRVPKARKPWDGSNPRMALFVAAGLAITHFIVNDDDLPDIQL